jgi:hypothetical protein
MAEVSVAPTASGHAVCAEIRLAEKLDKSISPSVVIVT